MLQRMIWKCVIQKSNRIYFHILCCCKEWYQKWKVKMSNLYFLCCEKAQQRKSKKNCFYILWCLRGWFVSEVVTRWSHCPQWLEVKRNLYWAMKFWCHKWNWTLPAAQRTQTLYFKFSHSIANLATLARYRIWTLHYLPIHITII